MTSFWRPFTMRSLFLTVTSYWCHKTQENVVYHSRTSFWCQLPSSCYMGLSQKPRGRFCLFLAGKLIWLSRHHTQKSIILKSITEILEGFFITKATLLDFSKISFHDDALRPIKGLHHKFHKNLLRNDGGVSGCGHIQTLFYAMTRCLTLSEGLDRWVSELLQKGNAVQVAQTWLYFGVV